MSLMQKGSTASEIQTQQIQAQNWIEMLGEFQLKPEEYDIKDGVERVYIDEYKDMGDGKVYKGQYEKKGMNRDGIGI